MSVSRKDIITAAALILLVAAALIASCSIRQESSPKEERAGSVPGPEQTEELAVSGVSLPRGNQQQTGVFSSIPATKPSGALWRYEPEGIAYVSSPPAATEDTVFTDGDLTSLHALAADSGEERWRFKLTGRMGGAPAVANGAVFFSDTDPATIYAVNATDGALKWRYETEAYELSSPNVADGTVYAGGQGIYAIDAVSGSVRWRFAPPSTKPMSGSYLIFPHPPAVSNGVVYALSGDAILFALDEKTGSELWRYEGQYGSSGPPAVADGTVYFSTEGGQKRENGGVYAVDSATGKEKWKRAQPADTAVAVWGGRVFFGGAQFTALNADSGWIEWSVSPDDIGMDPYPNFSAPAVAGGVVYFGCNDRTLYAIDAMSGEKVWKLWDTSSDFGAPNVRNGTVYVGGYTRNSTTLFAVR